MPVATTAFQILAPSRCMASLASRAASWTWRIRSSGQMLPPPRLCVFSRHTTFVRGKCSFCGRKAERTSSAEKIPRCPRSSRHITPEIAAGPPDS